MRAPYNVIPAMRGFDRPWFLCGGWAVDGWRGATTREHGDIDISVFEDDQRALFDHLTGWELIAHDEERGGATTERWAGEGLALPAHIHARPPGADPGEVDRLVTDAGGDHGDDPPFEFIVNRRDGDDWLLHATWAEEGRARADDPVVRVPIARAIRPLPSGVRAVAPEVLLVLKTTAYRDDAGFPAGKTVHDASALVSLLDRDEREWARSVIARLAPPHPAVDALPWD